jgi:hypothetical protein
MLEVGIDEDATGVQVGRRGLREADREGIGAVQCAGSLRSGEGAFGGGGGEEG